MAIPFSEPSLDEIFEKNMLKGYKIDLGFHSVEGGDTSDLGLLTQEVGNKINMLGTKLGLVKEDGYKFPLMTFWDKLSILPNILRLFFSGESTMKNLDDISINETIEKYGRGKTKMLLELTPRVITTVNDLNKISTGETLRANQLNVKRGSTPVGYPIGGLGEVNNALSEGIKNLKGKIKLNTEVKQIIVKNKAAVSYTHLRAHET